MSSYVSIIVIIIIVIIIGGGGSSSSSSSRKSSITGPVPLVERYTSRICDRSLAGIPGLNPAAGMDVCQLWVSCVVR